MFFFFLIDQTQRLCITENHYNCYSNTLSSLKSCQRKKQYYLYQRHNFVTVRFVYIQHIFKNK